MTRLPPISSIPISSLMSPPDAIPSDTFSPTPSPAKMLSSSQQSLVSAGNTLAPMSASRSPGSNKTRVLPSPPVSPWPNNHKKNGYAYQVDDEVKSSDMIKDPVLYPNSDMEVENIANQPLFPVEPPTTDAEALVAHHMASQVAQLDKRISQPTREEYLLALSCVPIVGRGYNRNPGAWLKRQREEIEEQWPQTKRICAEPSLSYHAKVKIAPAPTPRRTKKIIKEIQPASVNIRAKRQPKLSPKARLLESPVKPRLATPETRAAGMKRPEDVDYNALPDYCPPTSTLPKNNPKSLKADWGSTNPLNLGDDPDIGLLHEAEVNLASTLRLSCATYLCSKRRIFESRLKSLLKGKEFRKTDAQQACKIDVNKASKLWTAYDKVGWFSKSYFEQYLTCSS